MIVCFIDIGGIVNFYVESGVKHNRSKSHVSLNVYLILLIYIGCSIKASCALNYISVYFIVILRIFFQWKLIVLTLIYKK